MNLAAFTITLSLPQALGAFVIIAIVFLVVGALWGMGSEN
jgi:hypothetical protein